MSWFQLSDELIDDPALGLLPPRYFRTYVHILCGVSKWGGSELLSQDGLHRYLRVSKQHLRKALELFEKKGLIVGGVIKHYRPERLRINSSEWAALRSQAFERDDFTCAYCGERGGKLECDHIVPHSKGGSDQLSNLATACFSCNRSKRDKTLEEWRRGKN